MKYSTGRAFRQALEERIRTIQSGQNIPIVRLRKQIAFERFIARLQITQPETWILKGGLAMQLRLGGQSRTTRDIDLLNQDLSGNIHNSLLKIISVSMGDWFEFEIGQNNGEPEDEFGGYRFPVVCRLDGRVFEQFHVDIGIGDPLVEKCDLLNFDPVLEFAGIPATSAPCYPIPRQLSEKLHALTRFYASGSSTRGKDFIDILLMAGLGRINGSLLSQAINSTFESRNTHPVPHTIPPLSQSIKREFNRLSREVGLKFDNLDTAQEALASFINPVLRDDDPGTWNNESWKWE